MLKSIVYRPVWLPVSITAALLFLALVLLFATAWRGMERLQPMQKHLDRMSQTQGVALRIQKMWLDHLNRQASIPPTAVADARSDIEKILTVPDPTIGPSILASLQRAFQVLGDDGIPRDRAIKIALSELNDVLKNENIIHRSLLREAADTAEFELGIAAVTMIALPGIGVLILILVRKRILGPLNNLGRLMSQLARHDYITASTKDIDPVLEPLIAHYNDMVTRLAELEREHRARHDSLESQVRGAARSLLEQQRNLAKAEQLAAVGELSARLAHELRNPLAGMQMALQNLQQEVSAPEQVGRIGLIRNELERITALLNGLLDQARHRPEALRSIDLKQTVDELLQLARYQIPEHIGLSKEIEPMPVWQLPENSLRRALLNLIINACHAIGDTPGSIHISAGRRDGKLMITVRDDGPGFPPAILQSELRSFHTTRAEGTGLGLTTVQEFVHKLHGDLKLYNLKPHGACVELTIPAAGDTYA